MSVHDIEMFRKLCGKSTLENVIIVTTGWGVLPWSVGEARGPELFTTTFKPALDAGAQPVRYRECVPSNTHDIIRRVIQSLLANPGLDMQLQRHQDELQAVREEVVKLLRDQREKLRIEFEQENREIREQTRAESKREIRRFREQARVKSEQEVRKIREQARVESEQEIHEVKEQARVELKQARMELERARVESEQEIRKVKEQTRVELDQEIHKAREQVRVESERAIRKVREHTRNRGGELFPP